MLVDKTINILIPMAGLGSRFSKKDYKLPKPLIPILGKPMIQAAVESLNISGNYIFIIRKGQDSKNIKKILKKIKPSCKIIEIDYLTEGAACTCLLAKRFIDNDDPLVITNCDQIMDWDSELFLNKLKDEKIDGAVVTYYSSTSKNSYIKINNDGYGIEVAEKKVISKFSLNGIHYWKKGSDFVSSAESLIEKNIRVNNEFYIAPTYNELINSGKRIIIHHIDQKQHHAVGTPEDLIRYESLQNGKNA